MSRTGSPLLILLLLQNSLIGRGDDPLSRRTAAPREAVTASLVADSTAITSGKRFTLGVRLDVPKGYYTYYKSPGSIGTPTVISFSAPAGFVVGPTQFPPPEIKHEDLAGDPVANFLYKHTTVVLTSVTPPDSLRPGDSIEFTASVSYQYCQESGACFPPKPQKLKLALPVAAKESDVKPSASAEAIAASRDSLPASGSVSKYAKVRAVLSQDKIRPGDRAILGAVVEIDPGYKLQMHCPPVYGLVSTDLIVDNVPGFQPIPYPTYPAPQRPKKSVAGFEGVSEYRNRFVIKVPVRADETLNGSDVTFSGLLRYQACTTEGACYPARFASFELKVPVAPKGVAVSRTNSELLGASANNSPETDASPADR